LKRIFFAELFLKKRIAFNYFLYLCRSKVYGKFMDLNEILKDGNLQNNFNEMIATMKISRGDSFIEPETCLQNVLNHIHTTHTFGSNASDSILFEHKSLLSQQYRIDNSFYKANEKPKDFGEAKILSNYIFAYLGIHDFYYSWDEATKKDLPAFGVFLPSTFKRKDISNIEINATRRDLSSSQSLPNKQKEFLSSELARTYATYQIANEHKDFWDYWGDCKKLENDAVYRKNLWEQKIEFHYLEKINCSDFAALLWPLEEVFSQNVKSINPEDIKKMNEFKKENPDVIIYPYTFEPEYMRWCFNYASFLVTDYFYTHLDYITVEKFKIEFEKWKRKKNQEFS